MKNIVIIGYGQLGAEVCKRHLDLTDRVYSVCRSRHPSIAALHQPIEADLDLLSKALTLPQTIDCLYYFAPPDNTNLADNRLKLFLKLHKNQLFLHIVYISTSGVYGNSNGEWVTEKTPVNPTADRSKRRLNAEQQLIKFSQVTNTKLTILRCAAIYSAKTINTTRIKANTKPVIKASQAPFTNRLHLRDLTEVCVKAMLHPATTFEIYNVSDGHPTTTTEHAWLLSDLAGVKRNKEILLEQASQYYSPAYMSYLTESKRLDISKLKQKLKPVFKFENSTDGIKQCLL
ncbi:MAG: NAD-dependent epimerase/dehydratase family protein [Gammaproteobacteria bacterium]|nr:NAD-dependent epimerase/dehydratase family protein [Gammaproteobacteria bacterium]